MGLTSGQKTVKMQQANLHLMSVIVAGSF